MLKIILRVRNTITYLDSNDYNFVLDLNKAGINGGIIGNSLISRLGIVFYKSYKIKKI